MQLKKHVLIGTSGINVVSNENTYVSAFYITLLYITDGFLYLLLVAYYTYLCTPSDNLKERIH